MTRSLAIAVALSVGLGVTALRAEEAAKPDAAKVSKGQQVYAAQHCSMCHSIAGKGNPKTPLDDVRALMTGAFAVELLLATAPAAADAPKPLYLKVGLLIDGSGGPPRRDMAIL